MCCNVAIDERKKNRAETKTITKSIQKVLFLLFVVTSFLKLVLMRQWMGSEWIQPSFDALGCCVFGLFLLVSISIVSLYCDTKSVEQRVLFLLLLVLFKSSESSMPFDGFRIIYLWFDARFERHVSNQLFHSWRAPPCAQLLVVCVGDGWLRT